MTDTQASLLSLLDRLTDITDPFGAPPPPVSEALDAIADALEGDHETGLLLTLVDEPTALRAAGIGFAGSLDELHATFDETVTRLTLRHGRPTPLERDGYRSAWWRRDVGAFGIWEEPIGGRPTRCRLRFAQWMDGAPHEMPPDLSKSESPFQRTTRLERGTY